MIEKNNQQNFSASNYQLLLGDAFNLITGIPSESISFVVTDPPYFIDGMDDSWDEKKLKVKVKKAGVIGGLPIGMKFDTEQGVQLYKFMKPMAKEIFRVLKPGAFCVCFSQGRLYHRMALAFEDAGFEIRDMFCWKYEGQAKAFTQDHFIRKNKEFSEEQKNEIIKKLQGRKTPQLKPQMEPMVLAQKPREGTFIENWLKYEVGLIDTNVTLDGKFPGTVMEVSKRNRTESTKKIDHLTIKPIALIEHLIRLFTLPEQVVLDPFLGSGSHGVAAITTGRKFIGFEVEEKYYQIALERLKKVSQFSQQKLF